ncbi:MAG: hypothetical protein ACJ75B_02620 [Flavisolibacter sp.]
MVEKQTIRGKTVWFQIDACPADRENPRTIPTEYFTASYFFEEPAGNNGGEMIRNESGETKLFESPVEALTYARKKVESSL